MGLRYIWIDALCTVQDSKEDWLRESAMMLDVHSASLFTLAATASADNEGGLFRERHPDLVKGIRVIRS